MRLLIVEDDLDGREMLTELFRLHAWQDPYDLSNHGTMRFSSLQFVPS